MSDKVIACISPGKPWGVPYDATAHDVQAIIVATNALLDVARTATPGDALKLVHQLIVARERLNAVIDRAFDQADGFGGTQ